jgi:GntR family transcriptional repressor for pyruvate dehydrogenase complex
MLKLVKWSGQFMDEQQVIPTMTFGTFKRSAIAEEISTRLLSLIQEKRLRPGDKLPPERELAAMMQVSRPSLREALRALSIMKVIEIRQGSGAYVTSLEPSLLVEHLDFVFSLDTSTFLELAEARKIIEVGIVALAAERITDEQIAELEACVAEAAKSVDDYQAFLEADLKLHELITEAACNPILSRVMASISKLSLASRSRTTSIPGIREETVEDHRAIVAALKARDPEAARQAMFRHLEKVGKGLEEIAIPDESRGEKSP